MESKRDLMYQSASIKVQYVSRHKAGIVTVHGESGLTQEAPLLRFDECSGDMEYLVWWAGKTGECVEGCTVWGTDVDTVREAMDAHAKRQDEYPPVYTSTNADGIIALSLYRHTHFEVQDEVAPSLGIAVFEDDPEEGFTGGDITVHLPASDRKIKWTPALLRKWAKAFMWAAQIAENETVKEGDK